MRVLGLIRCPTSLLRSALIALALVLGANAIAHAEHDHLAAPHAAACGYCVTFGGFADAPTYASPIFPPVAAAAEPTIRTLPFVGRPAPTLAQPRAPPVLSRP